MRPTYLHKSKLMGRLVELEGKVLLCYCGNDERCHGDVLIKDLAARGATGGCSGGDSPRTGSLEEVGNAALPVRITWDEWGNHHGTEVEVGGWRGKGLARRVRVMGRERPFHDGGGLCSPGRWPLEKRKLPGVVGGDFLKSLRSLLERRLRESSHGKSGMFDLAMRPGREEGGAGPIRGGPGNSVVIF